jgi:hypothetical protein
LRAQLLQLRGGLHTIARAQHHNARAQHQATRHLTSLSLTFLLRSTGFAGSPAVGEQGRLGTVSRPEAHLGTWVLGTRALCASPTPHTTPTGQGCGGWVHGHVVEVAVYESLTFWSQNDLSGRAADILAQWPLWHD